MRKPFSFRPEDPRSTGLFSLEEQERYGRHFTLPEVGFEGQARLKQARVLLVGAGGLGAPVALYLAAAGVGRLAIVDGDRVDVTNLQRQVVFTVEDVGRLKAEAACERLRALNPNVHLVSYPVRLTHSNAPSMIREYDIVVDGSDNFATRYLVNDTCTVLGIPHVHGSVLRFEGQVSLFGADDGPCYRCLFPEPPGPGTVPDCAEAGVLGVLPGLVGAVQAAETIKWILQAGTSLSGRLLRIDALTMRFSEVAMARDPACPVCGSARNVPAPDRSARPAPRPKEEARVSLPEMNVKELKRRLDAGDNLVLVDVREPHEHSAGNIGGTLIPMGEIPARMDELDANAEIVVYCRTGNRSARVVEFLQDSGFEHVWNLTGGIRAWSNEIDSSVGKF
ncbi:MAG TPA: TOMM precursor leader peptide-binding protein [Candidatus Krumholzibacteria bacterium]|nr:TOMM precursor leader peptide-binding protein [Candidatus Krumholzibacteria bacterium]